MEDGYLGEAIGKQFTPQLNFQHRDVLGVHLPLKTVTILLSSNLLTIAKPEKPARLNGRRTDDVSKNHDRCDSKPDDSIPF